MSYEVLALGKSRFLVIFCHIDKLYKTTQLINLLMLEKRKRKSKNMSRESPLPTWVLQE